MKKNNVALIGYGYWGKKLHNYLKSSEDFNINYVFFRGLKKLSEEDIKKKYGDTFTRSFNTILKDKNVPSLIIATPINSHYRLVKQALMSDKNVLVEKPLAKNPSQAKELLTISRKRGLKLETEYTFTYSQALSTAQKLISDGTIGSLESITISKKQLGRFLPYDVYNLLGTHCLAILDMFLPISKYKFQAKPLITHKQKTTAAIIYFEERKKLKNICGHIDLSLHCQSKETKMAIYGKKGTLIYTPNSANTLSLTCFSRFQLDGGNKVAILREKAFSTEENHNIQLALKHFSKVLGNKLPDNSKRALDVTKVLSEF